MPEQGSEMAQLQERRVQTEGVMLLTSMIPVETLQSTWPALLHTQSLQTKASSYDFPLPQQQHQVIKRWRKVIQYAVQEGSLRHLRCEEKKTWNIPCHPYSENAHHQTRRYNQEGIRQKKQTLS